MPVCIESAAAVSALAGSVRGGELPGVEDVREEEPPLTRAEALAAGTARLIVGFLCVAPAALFPVGLAYKVFTHLAP
ncbi:MAG: hypothetical protein JSR90_06440 [Proteobacteria bacterium]|nr:hypothetical protein [Pseudomonadota bacterium]